MKRLSDITIVLLLSPVAILFCFIIALLVKINLGSPVFFIQPRTGLNGKTFNIIKFKTMSNHRDSNGCLLPDHMRLSKFGELLRSTSLDELPELWNVIKGEMSIVGPRPLLIEYLPLYNSRQNRRHEVLPGITGWAQVNGRNSLSWNDKFEMDIWYIDNYSFILDVKIMFMTILAVIKRLGITQEGKVTVDKFKKS